MDSVALNAAAIKNGRDLARKNSFILLCRSEDDTLLYGDCLGSGSDPYRCSVDFIKPEAPTFRCTCPSRQFPCKHLLGLMYAYVSGKTFTPTATPQDIADKRDKAEKREEKKEVSAEGSEPEQQTPRKRQTNASALKKKIAAQLEGIELADKLLAGLTQSGLGGVDKKTVQTLGDQVKQLGNYFIPGIQMSFRALLLELNADQEREAMYTGVIPHLITLHALLKKSREVFNRTFKYARSNPYRYRNYPRRSNRTCLATGGASGSRLNRARCRAAAAFFRSYTDLSREEFVDEGHWIQLRNGRIHVTRTYRPYRAAKYIKEEDSFYQVAQSKELYVYPGELNARVRWEDITFRQSLQQDYATALGQAHRSFADVAKLVKNQIKNPLSDKHPIMLLAYRGIVTVDGQYALVDEQNKQIPLGDIPRLGYGTMHMLPLLKDEDLRNGAMLVMFQQDFERNRLTAQPLSIVTTQGVIRLMY